ncbi:hypothetical protein AA309_00755 [Microvirga vignae]|uniref:Uncharacterized protein n=1 Tax=Microvirga vignae TaxID=1225564 RepID=A0A0H1RJI9_9HYPH|nr:hypothetical protein [Microvirga vignae]KLK95011.1 hypothetical protein AA309_00755 [Microvirga vignae]
MRVVALFILGLASLVSGGVSAQDWTSLSMIEPSQDARWNACYKETRLIYRTRNMSEQQYRAIIKDARRVHMRDCMARAVPPRPMTTPDADEKKLPSSIAGWAANP